VANGAELPGSGLEADEPQTFGGLTAGGAERASPVVDNAQVTDEGLQAGAVSRGGDNRVDVGTVAVGEPRAVLIERRDARDDLEAPGPDGVQYVPIDDGGGLAGAGQSPTIRDTSSCPRWSVTSFEPGQIGVRPGDVPVAQPPETVMQR
jgi:hypothetical protein